MATTGHESEAINVKGLKASLQKFKTDISDKKATKVTSATNGNFAGLDANGNITDSGKKPSDYYTKTEIDAKRSPTYNPATKRYTFPANATFEYQAANKRIVLSQ